jgi:hypothetical protein
VPVTMVNDNILLNFHVLEQSHLMAPTDPVTPAALLPSAAISRAPPCRWTSEEDGKLRNAVDKNGTDSWKTIAEMVPGRDNASCRQRWVRVLFKWTPEENAKLKRAVNDHVDDWVAVGELVPGRTIQHCQERWDKMLESNMTERTPEEDEKLMEAVQRTWQTCKPRETVTEDLAPPVSPEEPTNTRPRKAAQETKDAEHDDSISEEPTSRKSSKRHRPLDTDDSDNDSGKEGNSPPGAGDSPITDLTNRITELSFSASNIFGGALNSSDTHLGAELLTFTATLSQQVPDDRLCKVLLDLIMFGPKSEGIRFPDCHRMELATNYVSLLLSKPGFAAKLSRVAEPSFWKECLDQMTSPIYTVDGDEHRITAAAIGRTGQSLQVKTCCAELFLALLSRELKGFVRKQHDTDIDTDTVTTFLGPKSIVKHILEHPRRAREALEKSLKACTQIWSMYGHFILCDLPDLEAAMEADDGPSDVSVAFVRSQASRLVEVMGKLCSYLAWLYGFDASEKVLSLAYLINNGNMPQELEETTFDPAPFSDAADYSKEVRLSFLLNLDETCVPKLKPVLAEMLGFAPKYNAICG